MNVDDYWVGPAPAGSLCQSLAHDFGVEVPAEKVASVILATLIVAQVSLCADCAGRLPATDSAAC